MYVGDFNSYLLTLISLAAMTSPAKLTYTIRAIQAILAAATIGLAVVLIVDQSTSSNAALNYGLAVGILTFLGAAAGVLALWIPILQGLILLSTDVVVLMVNIAGGVVCQPYLTLNVQLIIFD